MSDPRNKLEGLEDHLQYYFNCIDQLSNTQDIYTIAARNKCEEASIVLSELFSQFYYVYGGQVPATPPTPVNVYQFSGKSFVPLALSLQNHRFRKHKGGRTSGSTHSEIDQYF